MKIISMCLGPLQTNCYIIYGKDKKAAVIDPAFYADSIQSVLDENELILDKILLTHAHFDHIMAVEELRKNGAELYLHADDEEMLNSPKLNCMLGFMGKSLVFKKPEHLLKDGDTVDIGGEKIRVMHTPGHTKGSVCYITDGVIFSGDTLFCGSIGRTDLYGGDYETLINSLKKLSVIEENLTVLSGHGERTTLQKEKNDNIYMKTLR
jgi:glyoxylase-like metal-dependent hydrolase (beta-lactamase superfamily II)